MFIPNIELTIMPHRKYNGMIDKGQQVELLIKQDDHKVEQPDEKSNAANEIITSGVLSDFDIGEWRRKETKWEECKKTLEENIHKLKAEIKEQNEFLEVRKKGKNQKSVEIDIMQYFNIF